MDTSEDRVIVIKSEPLLVRFEPSLKKEIAKRAEKEGMSEAAIVRMAVRAFLDPSKGRK